MSMKMNVERMNDEMVKKIVSDDSKSKSGKVRELFMGGLDVKEISELLGIRYNFSYNVVSNLVMVDKLEVVKEEKNNVKENVIKLLEDGKKKIEISKELGVLYNYVFKIEKEWKLLKERKVESK